MTADFRKINLAMQSDPDFRELPPAAQHLYYTLWCHPKMSYCGVVDWRPGRIAAGAYGWSASEVIDAGACLESRYFIIADDETEECLVRSWVRFDGLMKQPRMAVSFASAFHAVASNEIRGVIVHEANRLRELEPTLAGWAKSQVTEVLSFPSINPKARAIASDPFGDGFAHSFAHSLTPGLAEVSPSVSGSVCLSPTTATTTATYNGKPKPDAGASEEFDVFWDLYPRKLAVGQARKAWKGAMKKTDPATILDSIRASIPVWAEKDISFTPHASTWLNGERWNDVLDAKPARGYAATGKPEGW